MDRPGALPPGTRIADLELQRCTGMSPLGFEYLAHSAGSATPCRVVEYLPAKLADRRGTQVVVRPGAAPAFDAGRRAFQLDADRFALPRHDSLAVARRLLVEHGTAYVQLPWIDGQTLADEIGRYCAPVDPAGVRGWLRALGGALAQLHRSGVAHAGVSPSRVLSLSGGAMLLGMPASERWALSPWLPELIDIDDPSLAPEQLLEPTARAQAVGPWTDVYSLATLAHLAIAGRLPPPARRREECLSRPSLVNFAGGRWDAAMLLAIDRALSPDPASRPRSMDDFMASMGLMERRGRPRLPGESLLHHVLDRPSAAPPGAGPVSSTVPPALSPAAPTPPNFETLALPADWLAATRPEPPRSSSAWQFLIVLLFAVLATAAIWASARPTADGSPRVGQRPSEMPVSAAVRSKG